MNVRFILIAAMLVNTSAFAAEPAKAPAQVEPQAQPRAAAVVLASAEQVQAPASTEQQPAATQKPHRIARVTSCRCGDQQAQPDDDR